MNWEKLIPRSENRLVTALYDTQRALRILQEAVEALQRGDGTAAALSLEVAAKVIYAARAALGTVPGERG